MTEGGGQKAEDRRQGTEGRGRLKGGQMIAAGNNRRSGGGAKRKNK